MNNQLGTTCVFSTKNITQNAVTGSVIDFKLKKKAELKYAKDGSNNVLQVNASSREKIATLSVLLQTSGSALTLPEVLDTVTLTNPHSADVSGSWAITGEPTVDWKSDDYMKLDMEVTQWITTAGQLP